MQRNPIRPKQFSCFGLPSVSRKIPASLKFLLDFKKYRRSFQYAFKVLLKNTVYILAETLHYLCLCSPEY